MIDTARDTTHTSRMKPASNNISHSEIVNAASIASTRAPLDSPSGASVPGRTPSRAKASAYLPAQKQDSGARDSTAAQPNSPPPRKAAQQPVRPTGMRERLARNNLAPNRARKLRKAARQIAQQARQPDCGYGISHLAQSVPRGGSGNVLRCHAKTQTNRAFCLSRPRPAPGAVGRTPRRHKNLDGSRALPKSWKKGTSV